MNWTVEQLVTLIRDIKNKRWTGKITLNCVHGSVKVLKEQTAKPAETTSLEMK